MRFLVRGAALVIKRRPQSSCVSFKHVFPTSIAGRIVVDGPRLHYGKRLLNTTATNAATMTDAQATNENAEELFRVAQQQPRSEVMNQSLCLGSILVGDPKKVTPDEVISQLPRIQHQKPGQLGPNVVFLVTRSFASWADQDHDFLAKALRHMYSSPDQSQPRQIQSHIAVVDSLPSPPGQRMYKLNLTSYHEGLAFFTSHKSIKSERPKHKTLSPSRRDENDNANEIPHITVKTYCDPSLYSAPGSNPDDLIGGYSWPLIQEYNLPIANTVFQNGRDSTLYEDHWDLVAGGESVQRSNLSEFSDTRERSHLTLECTSRRRFFSCPIVEVTEPREIISCMGNVISRVSDDKENELPASSDLEAEIPKFVANRGPHESQKVQVYALVVPQAQKASIARSLENCLLLKRGHLHRVTSGGGGWGAKAGLLSIDPAFGLPEFQESRETVAVGDALRFFVSQRPLKNKSEEKVRLATGVKRALRSTTARHPLPPEGRIMVGVCPSEDDQHPSDTDLFKFSKKSREGGNNLCVFRGLFGMLSEKPMIVHFPQCLSGEQPFSSTLGAPWTTLVAEVTRERPVISELRLRRSKLQESESVDEKSTNHKAPDSVEGESQRNQGGDREEPDANLTTDRAVKSDYHDSQESKGGDL